MLYSIRFRVSDQLPTSGMYTHCHLWVGFADAALGVCSRVPLALAGRLRAAR
jgi:hypothetical protein